MKIINWNVGRPSKTKSKLILDKLDELNGDIVILTETNSSIKPKGNQNLVATNHQPHDFDGNLKVPYKPDENRTSIWTKYPVTNKYKTYDGFTSVCADIATPHGQLTVFATIIGVFNGLRPRFHHDLQGQLLDFDTIFPGKQVAVIGDYNITFTGRAYPSHATRQTLNQTFDKHNLTNLTGTILNAVDHIAISSDFIKNKTITLDTWNLDKKISDHIGFAATITV
jgi:endonuclease/exonuclease/phosphatase family metal-dependent hydrolase